jgi:penicillin amidase
MPNDMMTATLLRDSMSIWWDDRKTPAVETRDELIAQVMKSALDSTIAQHGAATSDGWRWDKVRHANILHLTRLPAFSRLDIPVQGGNATLWPSTGDGHHGPSWRMVVEMSTPRKAWAIYPGGQSGNPLSAHYDDRIDKWSHGLLDTLRLPVDAAGIATNQQQARLTLTPKGGAIR